MLTICVAFAYVGNALGTSADECKLLASHVLFSYVKIFAVKLVFSFYLSYPLAAVLKRIPDKNPWQKNAFIIGHVVSPFHLT